MPARIRRLDEKFSAGGLRSVILFHLAFQLGAMPLVALVVWFGHDALPWIETHGAQALVVVVLIVAAGLIARRMLRPRRV